MPDIDKTNSRDMLLQTVILCSYRVMSTRAQPWHDIAIAEATHDSESRVGMSEDFDYLDAYGLKGHSAEGSKEGISLCTESKCEE